MLAYSNCIVTIDSTTFTNNSGLKWQQGVILSIKSDISLTNCIFVANRGSVIDAEMSNLMDFNSVYKDNVAGEAVVLNSKYSNVTYVNCHFKNNHAPYQGGVIKAEKSVLNLTNCYLRDNSATYGGAITMEFCTANINGSTFTNNTATIGSAIRTVGRHTTISNTLFSKNIAADTGAMYIDGCVITLISVQFVENTANTLRTVNSKGILYAVDSTLYTSQEILISGNKAGEASIVYLDKSISEITGEFMFTNNSGSFLVINGRTIFNGEIKFQDCYYYDGNYTIQKGGAVTIIESTVHFIRSAQFIGNHAKMHGGAIHATRSTLQLIGQTLIQDNSAEVSGGGVYLFQSKLNCVHNCTFSGNVGKQYGGAIYAIASTVYAEDEQAETAPISKPSGEVSNNSNHFSGLRLTYIIFNSNEAERGGAIAFEMNSRIYGGSYKIIFRSNLADYGGAIYVDDYSTSGTCASTSYIAYSASTECFIQTLNFDKVYRIYIDKRHYQFVDNIAVRSGPSLYGGLLDRCTVSPISDLDVYLDNITTYNTTIPAAKVKRNVQDDRDIQLISSDPVRLCFCREFLPDCNYQWPTERAKKGSNFMITLVAVDQVNHTVNATIRSFLTSPQGGLGEGQQSQTSYETCTNLTFNAYSPLVYEKLTLYAEGPCNNTGISKRLVDIKISPCNCPIGFQAMETGNTRCDCNCDKKLKPYITQCNSTTKMLVKESTAWIGYLSHENNTGYIIYRYCPYDYCHPPTSSVMVNLNVPNGSDSQCELKRSKLLCGACRQGFSLSLGSSRCIQCPRRWPGLLVALILAAILGGFALVAIILVLNLTTAVGTIGGLIFYANIIAANISTYVPDSSHPNVLTIFIAWLNLDLGIDVCFYEGMDSYAKQWIQLLFPTYVLIMVAMIILVSERSARFSKLIGRGNPVSTLATLILLSYTKYLRATINIFSFAILKYPDGSNNFVWLPDANIAYLSGKHIPLFLAAVIIVTFGTVYTFLLLTWMCLLKLPRKPVFKWIQNTRLNSFMDAYLAPHTTRHRYWTGLLLLSRVVLYLVSALNFANNPRVILLTVSSTISGLFILKSLLLAKVYKQSSIELLEFSFYFNILLLSLACFYTLDDPQKQMPVAYTSIGTSFVLFLGIILYHIILRVSLMTRYITEALKDRIKNRKQTDEVLVNLLADDNTEMQASVAPTSTVVEISPQHSTDHDDDNPGIQQPLHCAHEEVECQTLGTIDIVDVVQNTQPQVKGGGSTLEGDEEATFE